MKTCPSKFPRKQRGSAALIAIVTMTILVIMGLAGATLSMNARLMSSRKTRDAGVRALAEAGIEYGYWQFAWNRVALPYNESNHALGEGSFTVRVADNSGSVSESIQVTSTATLRGANYTSTRVFRSDQQTQKFSINPASTFLYFPDYGAVDAQRIQLSSLDIHWGDTIRLTVSGSWGPVSNPSASTATNLVFSKTLTLLAPGSHSRVPDAIASSAPGYISLIKSGTASDIPEDFSITNTLDIVVPEYAKYLLVGVDYTQAVNISADNYSLEVKKISDGGHANDPNP